MSARESERVCTREADLEDAVLGEEFVDLLRRYLQLLPPPLCVTGVPFRGTPYRGTSLIRNSAPLGPYSRTMLRALRWS